MSTPDGPYGGHNLWRSHAGVAEHTFASFDVHQGLAGFYLPVLMFTRGFRGFDNHSHRPCSRVQRLKRLLRRNPKRRRRRRRKQRCRSWRRRRRQGAACLKLPRFHLGLYWVRMTGSMRVLSCIHTLGPTSPKSCAPSIKRKPCKKREKLAAVPYCDTFPFVRFHPISFFSFKQNLPGGIETGFMFEATGPGPR